jgi:hypothetical protein
MGTDGACGLLFCAAKRSGAFPPNMPGVRLLVVMVLQRVFRAVMMCGYGIRHAGSGLSRGRIAAFELL